MYDGHSVPGRFKIVVSANKRKVVCEKRPSTLTRLAATSFQTGPTLFFSFFFSFFTLSSDTLCPEKNRLYNVCVCVCRRMYMREVKKIDNARLSETVMHCVDGRREPGRSHTLHTILHTFVSYSCLLYYISVLSIIDYSQVLYFKGKGTIKT